MKFLQFSSLALALAWMPSAFAAQTGSLRDEGYGAFFRGDLKNLSLSQQGEIESAPQLVEVARLQQPVVWAAVADANGNLILGTGNRGEIVRLAPDGSTEVLFAPDAVLSRALAVAPDGSIFVGTSPNGTIYRLPPDGSQAVVFHDLPDAYLWDLQIEDGALWAVTGLRARMLRIPLSDDFSQAEDPEVWLETGDDHLTTLERDGERWLVGASGKGIVYAVTGPEEVYGLAHVDQEEIRAIRTGEDGSVYFTSFTAGNANNRRPEQAQGDLPPFVVTASGGTSDPGPTASENRAAGSEVPKGSGYLYRVDANGFSSALWRSSRSGLFSLARLNDTYWLGGSNEEGKLFYFADQHDWGLLHQMPRGGEIGVIVPVPDGDGGYYIITSNPGVVYRLGGVSETPGIFESRVLDAQQPAHWGTFELTLAEDGPHSISTRAGNTPGPDATWSDWAPLTDGAVGSPTGRYLQYRVEIPGDSSARLLRARVFYQLPNVAPQIAAIRVLNFGADLQRTPVNGQALDFSSAFREGPVSRFDEGAEDRLKLVRRGEQTFRTIVWRAGDPNGDPLSFDLFIRPVDGNGWTTLARDLRDPAFVLNAAGLPAGYYQVKLIASDRRGNAEDIALSQTRVSELVLLDTTPPVIERLPDESNDRQLVLSVTSDASYLVAAQVTIDGQDSVMLRPRDALFDQLHELFVIPLPDDLPANASVVFEVLDESGNQAVYTENRE